MSNSLKAYVRYDVSGRVIAGSLILSRFKPAVGKWKEINSSLCCNPTPGPVIDLILELTFDDISSANNIVGDATSVTDWNTFFDLPAYGNPFSSVTVIGNVVTLNNTGTIAIKEVLFGDENYLLKVIDTGCVTTIGDSAFAYMSSLTEISFPACTETLYDSYLGWGSGCFGSCYNLISINMPALITAGDNTFDRCSSVTTFDLPLLITAGYSCFEECSAVISFDLPAVTTVGDYCFFDCTLATTFNLPNLITAGEECFDYCYAAITFNLPSLVTAGYNCFYDCENITTFNLPNLITAGDGCFDSCYSLTSLSIPSCTSLGTTTGYNAVFISITGQTITLTVPPALMTCNGGEPDGDIAYLGVYNSVTINGNLYRPFTGYSGDLSLTFDNISSANTLVGDASNVADWNTFFNLPLWSTPFTSVEITLNTVKLIGGENIIIRPTLFQSYTSLIEVIDTGCVCYIQNACFYGCTSATTFDLPSLTTAGDNCFNSCSAVTSFNLPAITTAGQNCFYNCTSVITFSLPALTTTGQNCFQSCTSATTFNLPVLTTAGGSCFSICTSATTFDLPNLITAEYYCFQNCSSVTTFDLPELTTAGSSCFSYCSSATTFNLPALTAVGGQCFYQCTLATTFDLPVLTTTGQLCFQYCTSATTFNLLALTTAGDWCFQSCTSATTFDLPALTTAGWYCFQNCSSATTFNLPALTTAGYGCFEECLAATTYNLPNLIELGPTTGDNLVFNNITAKTITLTIPSALMTCNGGNPDGDITYLQANDTVTIITI